ncbi:putative MYND finger [Lyophyllum shimeji]|uniref:MYND finger n=1 Tax=Lyophyllum shimeji TaxID=47721 RepID=A0A9P3PPG4_LYOSH|nr:putative MYND finger [Lyophyllum shimeji]
MPGPGHKKKSKPRAQAAPQRPAGGNSESDAYVGNLNNADGWGMICDMLCVAFEIPDLTTKSGLKKVHANFDAVYRRLDKACTKYPDNERIVGGVLAIFAKMCADSILRNKLHERGLLTKLLPLLDSESTRHMALRALGTITHHGGGTIRKDIARRTTATLIKLIEEFPDDKVIAELVVTVLSHSISGVVEGEKPSDPTLLASLDLRAIFKVVTETSRKEWASQYLINHAVSLLATATLNAADICKAYPPMLKFLVAGLRSADWVMRCTCLGGIIRLHRNESELDMRTLDPNKFIGCIQRGFPPHLQDRMMDYGLPRCDTYLTLATTRDYQAAMMACAQDHDLRALGLKLAELILRTEFSIADGMFQAQDPRTGRLEVMDIGLPFTRWIDALPPCARAVRTRGNAKDADLADILDIKYHIMKQRIPDAVDVARKGLKRNPGAAYFYYAITLSADNTEGLRAAKKGLKCKHITPFVRFQLMQRAVEHAGNMGIQILQESPAAGKGRWEEGIAFLMSALEDAKTFVEEAPPDNRHMNAVLYWYILLTITINGPGSSTDLRELQSALKGRKIADDFCAAIDIRPPRTNLRLAQETVVKLYTAAAVEFGPVVQKADAEERLKPVSPEKLEDELAAWLENTHVHDEVDDELHGLHPKVNTNAVALYRCSFCGNPSAVLRKCSGCAKARYCDSGCQKSHWPDHKKMCSVATSN